MLKAMREAKVFTSWLNPSQRARAGDDALRRDRARAGQHGVPQRLPAVSRASVPSTASTTRWRSWRSRSARPACPTSIRERSCGTSAWSIPTTAGRSTTSGAPAAALLDEALAPAPDAAVADAAGSRTARRSAEAVRQHVLLRFRREASRPLRARRLQSTRRAGIAARSPVRVRAHWPAAGVIVAVPR